MPAEEETLVTGRPVTVAEVKALIEREQGTRAELSYEQKLALEHSTHFARMPPEKALKLVAELKAVGGKITEWHAHKIADVAPTHPDDVRAIFQKDRVTPEKDEIEKILEIVRGYL